MILADTAREYLEKQNPRLFKNAENSGTENAQGFEDTASDAAFSSVSYHEQNAREMSDILIKSLSDEERLSFLMYYIEKFSIHEISEAMRCSEETVIASLNSGSKNLLTGMHELNRRGYGPQNVEAEELLVSLLRAEESEMNQDGSISSACRPLAGKIFSNIGHDGETGKRAGQYREANTIHEKRSKRGGFSGAKYKVAIVLLSLCILFLGFYGVKKYVLKDRGIQNESTADSVNNTSEEASKTDSEKGGDFSNSGAKHGENINSKEPVAVKDTDYPNLIEGSLSKRAFEYVLAYGPEHLDERGLSDRDCQLILNNFANSYRDSDGNVTFKGTSSKGGNVYSLTDMNRLMSSFTSYRFSEDNDADNGHAYEVKGTDISFFPATLSYSNSVAITKEEISGDTMIVYYTFTKKSYEQGIFETDKVAELKKNESGMYVIHSIKDVSKSKKSDDRSDSAKAAEKDEKIGINLTKNNQVNSIYKAAVVSVKNGEPGYAIEDEVIDYDYTYALADIDGDGIDELLISGEYKSRGPIYRYIRVFSVSKGPSGYTLKPIKGDTIAEGAYMPDEGNGIITESYGRGVGVYYISRWVIKDDSLVEDTQSNMELRFDSAEVKAYHQKLKAVNWIDVTDTSALE